MTETKICEVCGESFNRKPPETPKKWAGRRACSLNCVSKMGYAAANAAHARNRANLIEDVEWLLSWGEWPPRIAERVGKSLETIEKALYREGRPDLAGHFKPSKYREDVAA